MSSHHCWWTMQGQGDSQSYNLTKRELWSLSGADKVNSDQCANGFHKVMKPCLCSSNNILKHRGIWIAYLFGVLKQRKLFAIMEIQFSNIFECQKSRFTRQYIEDYDMNSLFMFKKGSYWLHSCHFIHFKCFQMAEIRFSLPRLPVNSQANYI